VSSAGLTLEGWLLTKGLVTKEDEPSINTNQPKPGDYDGPPTGDEDEEDDLPTWHWRQ
jgi:hypothetical protein